MFWEHKTKDTFWPETSAVSLHWEHICNAVWSQAIMHFIQMQDKCCKHFGITLISALITHNMCSDNHLNHN